MYNLDYLKHLYDHLNAAGKKNTLSCLDQTEIQVLLFPLHHFHGPLSQTGLPSYLALHNLLFQGLATYGPSNEVQSGPQRSKWRISMGMGDWWHEAALDYQS